MNKGTTPRTLIASNWEMVHRRSMPLPTSIQQIGSRNWFFEMLADIFLHWLLFARLFTTSIMPRTLRFSNDEGYTVQPDDFLHASASLCLHFGALDIDGRDNPRIATEGPNGSIYLLLFDSHRGQECLISLGREWSSNGVADRARLRKGTVDKVVTNVLPGADRRRRQWTMLQGMSISFYGWEEKNSSHSRWVLGQDNWIFEAFGHFLRPANVASN